LVFATDVIASVICWAATSGFVVSGGGDSIVDPHEEGVFSKLGDEFACVVSLSCPCYRSDRHEALIKGGVYPVFNLIQSLCEVPDRESLSKPPASISSSSVTLASSILGLSSLI
jgi:hypothetical protein